MVIPLGEGSLVMLPPVIGGVYIRLYQNEKLFPIRGGKQNAYLFVEAREKHELIHIYGNKKFNTVAQLEG